jgi:internalin A
MIARIALAAGLFALAAAVAPAPSPAQQPKKGALPKTPAPPKIDPVKIAAAQKALTGVGCQLSPETDRKSPFFGQTKQVSFPQTTNDDDLGAAFPHLLVLPGLTALDLGNTRVTDAGTAHLAKLPKLEAVYLDGLKVTTKTLDVLAGLPDLHWLVLTGRGGFGGLQAGKAEIAALGRLPGLQHLEITLAPAVTAADLEPVNQLVGLRTLTVTGGGMVGPEGVRHLTSPRQLTSLSLGTIPVGDEEAKVIGEAAGLKTLFFSSSRQFTGGGKLTDVGVQSLTGLRALTSLNLSGDGVTLAEVTGFGEMKALTYLTLAGCPVADAGLQKALELPALTSLSLSNTKATFESVGGLKKLTKLSTLTVTSSPVSDEGLRNIATLPAVQYLSLSATAVTNAGLKHIQKLRTLANLTLSDGSYRSKAAAVGGFTGDGLKNLTGSNIRSLTVYAAIDGADLKGLAGCKNLTTLTITGTTTDDTALKGLTTVRTLREVWAVDTHATKVGKAAVERALPGSVVHLEYPKGVAGPYVRTAGAKTTSP